MRSRLNILPSLKESIWRLRYYTSIETLPIETWFKIHQTGDLKLLIRNKFYFKLCFFLLLIPIGYFLSVLVSFGLILLVLLYKENPAKVWEKIYDEFIQRIGLSKEYTDYIERIKRVALLECEWVIEPSPINKAQLMIERMQLEDTQKQKNVEYSKIIAQVSKSQGYRINPKEVTVLEFYSYE